MKSKQDTIEKGFVLIVVLGMVMMLTVLLLGFSHKARTNLTVVDDFMKSEQAINCARAGLNIAIAAVRNSHDTQKNEKLEDLFLKENTFSIGEGGCSVIIKSENAKLNVNMLIDKNGKPDRTRIEQMLRLIELIKLEHGEHLGIGYRLVPAIMDWIDNDNEVTYLPFVKYANSGAESGFYNQLDNPYKCKNAPLDTTEELLLVKGITPEIFELLQDHVTVYSDGKININCASKPVIQSLSERIDPVLAQMIMDQQKFDPVNDITDLREIPGMTESVYGKIKKLVTAGTAGQYYHVQSRGTVGQINRTVTAIIKRDTGTKNIEVLVYKEL
jgi:general secretion pathway protein K